MSARFSLFSLLLLAAAFHLSAATPKPEPTPASPVQEFADREPTAEETLLLELINRFRADPKAEAARIHGGTSEKTRGFLGKGVDWKMFQDEMEALKPSPPLVFSLELLEASRKHSRYMILNELTHVEDPSKPGFVGASFGDRCKKAYYAGFAGGENCFRDASSPKHSHAGFVVDFGDGPGGMQPTRGHRSNMINPGFREVGCSSVPHGGAVSVTHDYGSRKTRMAGGVIYIDRKNEQFYDIGEGLAGVKISSSDGASTLTWKSGAYELDLKSDGPVTLTAEYLGQNHSQTFAAGKENVKFDWIVPEKAALDQADALLSAVEHIKDSKSSSYKNAVFNLYLGTRGIGLDEPRQKKVDALTRDIGAGLESSQSAVLNALRKIDPETFTKVLEERRKPYRGTPAEGWFSEAEMVASAKLSAAALEAAKEENPRAQAQNKKQLAAQIKTLEDQVTYPVFKTELSTLHSSLHISETASKRQKT